MLAAVALPGLLQLLDPVGLEELPGCFVGRLLCLRRASALSVPWGRLPRKLGGKKTPVPLRPASCSNSNAMVVGLLSGMMLRKEGGSVLA